MLKRISQTQQRLKVGSHGEDYGSWMSNPVFYLFGGLTLIAAVLAALSFAVFHLTVLGVLFVAAVAVLLAVLGWITRIRRQYAFGKGGMMERVHQTILSNLDYDGKGQLLEVGCGSGAMTIRAALTWPAAQVVGLDYWGAMYNYSKAVCEKNARSEGVGDRCTFVRGDANHLDYPDERFDAVDVYKRQAPITTPACNTAVRNCAPSSATATTLPTTACIPICTGTERRPWAGATTAAIFA